MLDFITVDEKVIDDIVSLEGFCDGYTRNAIKIAVLTDGMRALYEYTTYNARTAEHITISATDGSWRNLMAFHRTYPEIINSEEYHGFDEKTVSLEIRAGMLLKAEMTFSDGTVQGYYFMIG